MQFISIERGSDRVNWAFSRFTALTFMAASKALQHIKVQSS